MRTETPNSKEKKHFADIYKIFICSATNLPIILNLSITLNNKEEKNKPKRM